jgi:hypothetical protein
MGNENMTTHVRRLTAGVFVSAAVATLAACGAKTETEKPAAAAPASAAASTAASPPSAGTGEPTEGLSGDEFLAKAADLSGKTVTLQRCSLLTTPGSDGTLPCRVLDKSGKDISDASGLPVDIFVRQAELSPAAQAVVAGCSGFCTVQISGTLDRATDGTGYLSMTAVTLKPVS